MPSKGPAYILVRVMDASDTSLESDSSDAPPADLAGVCIGALQVARLAGERIDALCKRAAALHTGPQAVPVLLGMPRQQVAA
jgi:hypothetical protein